MAERQPARVALTLHQTARLVGAYCWAEERLFALTGRWSADPGMTPGGQVALFEASRRHGWLAREWAERLPVVAGLDPEALTRPSGDVAAAVEQLAVAQDPGARVVSLHGHLVPRLAATYRRHLDRCVAVADRPVARVLGLALDALAEEEAALTPVVEHLLVGTAIGETGAGKPSEPLVAWPGAWPGA